MKIIKNNRSIALLSLALALSACRGRPFHKPPVHPEQNMYKQPRFTAQSENDFFADHRAMRMPVEGTVARGHYHSNTEYYEGKTADGKDVAKIPVPITMALLKRGQNRFDIYCTPCHSRLGNGKGIVVQYGIVPPPSYHIKRLRDAADGYIFNVITNGVRTMPPYKYQIPVHDRWAIVSYVRSLQLSQDASKADLEGHAISDSAMTAYESQQKAAKEAAQKQAQAMKQKQNIKESPKELAALGKKLYQSRTCASCHSVDGSKGVGPSWKGLFGSKVELNDGKTVTADEAYIKESIMKPESQVVKGFQPVMPPGLINSPKNLQALVEYIKTLK